MRERSARPIKLLIFFNLYGITRSSSRRIERFTKRTFPTSWLKLIKDSIFIIKKEENKEARRTFKRYFYCLFSAKKIHLRFLPRNIKKNLIKWMEGKPKHKDWITGSTKQQKIDVTKTSPRMFSERFRKQTERKRFLFDMGGVLRGCVMRWGEVNEILDFLKVIAELQFKGFGAW